MIYNDIPVLIADGQPDDQGQTMERVDVDAPDTVPVTHGFSDYVVGEARLHWDDDVLLADVSVDEDKIDMAGAGEGMTPAVGGTGTPLVGEAWSMRIDVVALGAWVNSDKRIRPIPQVQP